MTLGIGSGLCGNDLSDDDTALSGALSMIANSNPLRSPELNDSHIL